MLASNPAWTAVREFRADRLGRTPERPPSSTADNVTLENLSARKGEMSDGRRCMGGGEKPVLFAPICGKKRGSVLTEQPTIK